MIRKLLIIIGSKTINSYQIICKKTDYKNNEKEIENKTFETIIEKRERIDINPNYKIMLILIPVIITLFLNNIKITLITALTIILLTSYIKLKPKIEEDKRKKDMLKNLPYALRQMSTQLKAGIGLYDAMKNISNSNYGQLSEEFTITLNEIQYGTNYVEAFKKLSQRNKTPIIEKLVSQIIRTLNNGGNLADTLNTLADENSYNMKIKYKEYSEKLNAIMLLYMFIAVLLPVITFIMIIAATTVMGSIIEPQLLLILYLFFFPMIIVFMIILIKRMEPTLT